MNSKTPLALAAAALVLFATTACNRNQDANGGTNNTPAASTDTAPNDTMPPATTDTPPAAGTGAVASQAEALTLLNAVNEHEIKAAEMAKSKNVTGPVLEYANMMQAEHGKNMSDTNALMQTAGAANATGNAGATAGASATAGADATMAANSARVTEQKAKAEAKRALLQGQNGEAFARAYIDAMVTDHAEALTMLDSMLIPAATDDAAKQHLQMTRGHIQQHLDKAKQIQGKLGGGAAPNA